MIFNLKDFSSTAVYNLLTQTIIPRPIAWILTQNLRKNSYNLAPFSYFSGISSDPPLLMFSISPKKNGELKDSAVNIIREKIFTINIANYSQLQDIKNSANPLAYGESEIKLTKQKLTKFAKTSLVRLQDCPIAFACKLYKKQHIGNAPQTLIFGEITKVYVNNKYASTNDGRIIIDPELVSPICRLGLGKFADITNIRN